MPETGQPGGAGGHRSGNTQGGAMAGGSRGPFIRSFNIIATPGNVTRTIKCPLGVRWNLLAAVINVSTDATVANRYAILNANDAGGNLLHPLLYSAAITASSSSTVTAGPSELSTYELNYPWPLVDGMQLAFSLLNGVAGDLWGGYFTVMEWKI